MTQTYDIAVVGATGLVGESLLSILAERNFPAGKVYALASERSLEKEAEFGRRMLDVEELAGFDFTKVQIAFFATDAEVAAEYVPQAVEAGCVVIDNSAQFRMDADVPLVIPEVNPEAVADYKERNIIASPASSTIQLLLALKPLHDVATISRVNVATYQAVSGVGRKAVDELAAQAASLLGGRPVEAAVFGKQMAFNVLPQVDLPLLNGYTVAEMAIVEETRKVLGMPDLPVNPSVVWVPVFFGCSAAVQVETQQKLTAAAARDILQQASGVEVMDGDEDDAYPTPVVDAANNDSVYVGRIREDLSHPTGLNLWVVVDNVRKGAALNAVQIAELLIKNALT